MAVHVSTRNLAADAIADDITHVSLHSADPDPSGSNELSGGSYAQQAVSYDAAVNGTADISSNVTFGAPGSETTATHLGFWSTATFRGSVALASSKTLSTGDTLTITSAPITVS